MCFFRLILQHPGNSSITPLCLVESLNGMIWQVFAGGNHVAYPPVRAWMRCANGVRREATPGRQSISIGTTSLDISDQSRYQTKTLVVAVCFRTLHGLRRTGRSVKRATRCAARETSVFQASKSSLGCGRGARSSHIIARIARVLPLAFIASLALTADAHAYVDPGTGSYVMQLLIAGVVGAAFAVKTFWRKIASFVGRLSGRKTSGDDPAG